MAEFLCTKPIAALCEGERFFFPRPDGAGRKVFWLETVASISFHDSYFAVDTAAGPQLVFAATARVMTLQSQRKGPNSETTHSPISAPTH